MNGMDGSEYRIARLRERLAREGVAELGIRIEMRGGSVLLSGALPTADHRDEILRIAEAELPGTHVLLDLTVASAIPPDGHEDLP
jgi:hypothetical protein